MTPKRPYLVRAVYQWVLDNGLTPYLLVDARQEGVRVPAEFVQDGRIVFNLAPTAVRALHMGNDHVEFSARFGGHPRQVVFPISAVLALYARENGQGMVFPEEPPEREEPPPEGGPRPERPTLRVVK
jgi:stringent starvation protein B